MLSGAPNLAFVFGYTNSSWTLKVGLICEHFCRLLTHMDTHGYDTAVPFVSDRGCRRGRWSICGRLRPACRQRDATPVRRPDVGHVDEPLHRREGAAGEPGGQSNLRFGAAQRSAGQPSVALDA